MGVRTLPVALRRGSCHGGPVSRSKGDLDQVRDPVAKWTVILHRDLRIENVLLGDPQRHPYSKLPTPKVCKSGTSAFNKQEGIHTRGDDDDAVGTALETAPEQDDSQYGRHTSKSEVWGLGCCLARLVSKRSDVYDIRMGGFYLADIA